MRRLFAVSSILVVIAIIILVVRAVIEYKGDKRVTSDVCGTEKRRKTYDAYPAADH